MVDNVNIGLWLTLIFLFILPLLYLYCQISSPSLKKYVESTKDNIKWSSLSEILDSAENGDIILMEGNTRGEKTCKWISGSIFSHVGILFREKHPETGEDILYILDCDVGQSVKKGVRVMPLEDKLKRYGGTKIAAVKRLNQKRPSIEEFVNLISKYISLEFDPKFLTWCVADYLSIYSLVKNSKTVFCAEFVALVMQDLNILEKDRPPAWYSPGNFYKNELALKDGYNYSDPVFFYF